MSAERYSHSWIDFGPAFESGQDDDGPVCDVPPWLAMVIVALEPGLDDDKGSEFLAGVTDKARRWPALDDAAWRRILVFFATECIQFTLDIAAPLQSDATQIEWDETYAACTSVLAALRGETDFAAAAVTAQYAANNLEPEVVSTNQKFMMVSADTTWAMKCGGRHRELGRGSTPEGFNTHRLRSGDCAFRQTNEETLPVSRPALGIDDQHRIRGGERMEPSAELFLRRRALRASESAGAPP